MNETAYDMTVQLTEFNRYIKKRKQKVQQWWERWLQWGGMNVAGDGN